MAVDAFHDKPCAVEVDAVLREELDGAESHSRLSCLHGLSVLVAEGDFGGVEVRVFGVPVLNVLPLSAERLVAAAAGDFQRQAVAAVGGHDFLARLERFERYGCFVAGCIAFHLEGDGHEAVLACVDDEVVYVGRGYDFNPHGAEYASVEPPVGHALCGVDGFIGRLFRHLNFQRVVLSELYEVCDVVAESVECSLVHFACLCAVYLHHGIGHHAVEIYLDALVFP